MHIEIISIGDELLSGATVNTNAVFISSLLFRNGWNVVRHLTLPDEERTMHQELNTALTRSSIVITTGGLGSTIDDWTKKVAADLFHSPFHFDEKIAQELTLRFGKELSSLKEQATVPTHAKIVPNRTGTAPGFIFSSSQSTLVCLPGVPKEMEAMFADEVIPYLSTHFSRHQLHCATLSFCLLNENAVDPFLRELKKKYPRLQMGIYPSYGTLFLVFRGDEKEVVELASQKIAEKFQEHLFPSRNGKIEEAIHDQMIAHQKTLALAESCTGGRIAAQLTALPGSSKYFLGSIVSYSNELKQTLLQVSPATLREKGAVSREAAREMVEGLLGVTDADIGLAVTGIAGPDGGSLEKPVGTIWAAIQQKGKEPYVWSFQESGHRDKVLFAVTSRLLVQLWKKIRTL